MTEREIFRKKMSELKTLQESFDLYEEKLNKTLHTEHFTIIFYLKGIERISKKINKKQETIINLATIELNSRELLLKEVLILREYGIMSFRETSIRFRTHAQTLERKLFSIGKKGIEYNEILEALRKLGHNIGKLESETNDILIKRKEIQTFENIIKSCTFLNKKLKKYNYLFATAN